MNLSERKGIRLRGRVDRKGWSHRYEPIIKGRHHLHVKVNDQHIEGSPFLVLARSPVEDLGTPINMTIDGLKTPVGITLNQRGEVVVAEGAGHCVSVFSPRGERLQSFGTHGSGQGQLDCPYAVAVDGKGDILVADSNNHRIQKFIIQGQDFLKAVSTKSTYFTFLVASHLTPIMAGFT